MARLRQIFFYRKDNGLRTDAIEFYRSVVYPQFERTIRKYMRTAVLFMWKTLYMIYDEHFIDYFFILSSTWY